MFLGEMDFIVVLRHSNLFFTSINFNEWLDNEYSLNFVGLIFQGFSIFNEFKMWRWRHKLEWGGFEKMVFGTSNGRMDFSDPWENFHILRSPYDRKYLKKNSSKLI